MGTKLFDYLGDSVLLDDHALSTEFAAITEDDLRMELARYREFALANLNELLAEVYACQSATKIFTGVRRPIELDLLKQGAFYIE